MRQMTSVLVVLAIVALASSPASAELVGNWTFDEGTGTTAYDTSGATITHDGTILNGQNDTPVEGSYVTGKIGDYALSFNGTGQWVKMGTTALPASDPLSLAATSYSVSFWINKASTDGGYHRIVNNDNGGAGGGGLSLYAAFGGEPFGASHDYRRNGNSPDGLFVPSTSAVNGTWQLATVTYTSGGGANNMKLYLDGVYKASRTFVNDIEAVGTTPFSIGGMLTYGQYYKGLLDDVSVWNNALTATQVATIANLGNSTLNYGALQAETLFDAFGAQQTVAIGDKTWAYAASGIDGADGAVNDLGGGVFSINLGGGAGMTTVIPEPGTLAMLAGVLVGLLTYAWRKRKQ